MFEFDNDAYDIDDRTGRYEFDAYEFDVDEEPPAGMYYYPRHPVEEDGPTWTAWRIILLVIALLIVLAFIGYELLPFIDPAFTSSPPPPPSTPLPRV